MIFLATIKGLLSRLTLVIEFCHVCGVRQPLVWWCADNKLWQEITGGDDTILCPKCFNELATQKGISLRWIAVEDYRFERTVKDE